MASKGLALFFDANYEPVFAKKKLINLYCRVHAEQKSQP
jgi:hypothetical protein